MSGSGWLAAGVVRGTEKDDDSNGSLGAAAPSHPTHPALRADCAQAPAVARDNQRLVASSTASTLAVSGLSFTSQLPVSSTLVRAC